MKTPLSLDECLVSIETITEKAQAMAVEASTEINAMSIIAAMQAGYRMACIDNGLPIPDMEDPKTTVAGQ